MTLVVRPVEPGDRSQWEPLWEGYLRFYATTLTPDVTDATWSRITAGDDGVGGLVAAEPDGLVGVLHFVTHPTTWSTAPACYLEDLFVAAEQRGRGVGGALIDGLAALGRERGWSGIHWITAHDNAAGMRLYDRLARRTTWVRYELDLDA